MVFTGSAGLSAAVLSSSCMPFLKALMPCATSPIRSEILPRPNNSRTTAITTIQCQMLSEPILQSSKHTAVATRPRSEAESRPGGVKNKDLGRSQIRARLSSVNGRPPEARLGHVGINYRFPGPQPATTPVPDRQGPADPRRHEEPDHPTVLER